MKNVSKLKKTEIERDEAKDAQKTVEEERDQKTKSIRELQVACIHLQHSYQDVPTV